MTGVFNHTVLILCLLLASHAYGEEQSFDSSQSFSTNNLKVRPVQRYTYSVALVSGMLNYPEFSNIPQANLASGLSLGAALSERWGVEASFLYSFLRQSIFLGTQDIPEDVDHFQFSLLGRYLWFKGKYIHISPGLALSYIRRSFAGGINQSNAYDWGGSFALDFPFATNWVLGLDYRLMLNISYVRAIAPDANVAANQQLQTGQTVENIESGSYQLLLLKLRYSFL